jgi:hypothetical protein
MTAAIDRVAVTNLAETALKISRIVEVYHDDGSKIKRK